MTELSQITFLMVGAKRCGTTWADEALREHPEVYVPPRSKLEFFSGPSYELGMATYLENFAGVGPQHRAIGEVESGYCQPHAVPRIARHLPHVRLIMAMRNPIDRAYSNYLSRRTLGNQAVKSFEDTIAEKPELLSRGHYVDQVECLLEHYPRDRILFLFYEDLVADDAAYLRSIFEFIGVDPAFRSKQIGQRRHAGQVAEVRYRLEKFGLKPLFRKLKRGALGNMLRKASTKVVAKNDYRHSMSRETRARLVEYYAPLNCRLGAIVGRDLSSWNR